MRRRRKKVYFIMGRRASSSELTLSKLTADTLRRSFGYTVIEQLDYLVNAKSIRDSVVHFVKFAPRKLCEDLRKRNNRVVYQVTDLISADKLHFQGVKNEVDVCVFPSRATCEKYQDLIAPGSVPIVLHHFWDPRFSFHNANEFKIAFVGSGVGLNWELHLDRLNTLRVLEKVSLDKDLFTACQKFSCHYSVRSPHTLSALYKPATKLFVAAACGANIVASRDRGFIEVLPDYPYYTGVSFEEVMTTIDKARMDFGTKSWIEAQELLRDLSERYSHEEYCKSLDRIFLEA